MLPIRTILCAIDFSSDSQHALRTAIGFAKQRPVQIVALHVVDLVVAQASATGRRQELMKNETAAALQAFVEADWNKAPATATFRIEVRVGIPEREVLAAARNCGASLIVAGTRGISGSSKLFFGSVVEKILRRTDVPVLAVPCPEDGATPAPLERVLAAIDVGVRGEATAAQAAGFARQLSLPLALIHAVPLLPTGWRLVDALDLSTQARVGRALSRLEEIAAKLGVPAQIDARVGSPTDVLSAAAAERPGTLLVVGLNADLPLARLGSTAYRIVCSAGTPVLAVPVHAPVFARAAVLATAPVIV